MSNAILIDKKKFKVIGFDINTAKIENLNKNVSYVEDVTENDLINFKRKSIFTSDLKLLENCNILIISVPTPLLKKSQPDLSYIESAVKKIKNIKPQKKIIILESTSYPGTTNKFFSSKIFSKSHIIFSPERINPGVKYKNGIKPNGFVLAPFITSQTFISRFLHISLISLTKAILTALNVFSNNLIISADLEFWHINIFL